MNRRQRSQLRRELLSAGATSAEVAGLIDMAGSLYMQPSHRNLRGLFMLSAIPCAVLSVMILVVFSRSVLPGNPLYAVQKTADAVAILVHPSYRETVMMRRAAQVEQLVHEHAPSQLVLATLADYTNEASAYTLQASHYVAFERCKHSLERASQSATVQEQKAIESSLWPLRNV